MNCFSGKSLGLNQSSTLKATYKRSEQFCVEVCVNHKGNIPNICTHAINVWQFKGTFKCNYCHGKFNQEDLSFGTEDSSKL